MKDKTERTPLINTETFLSDIERRFVETCLSIRKTNPDVTPGSDELICIQSVKTCRCFYVRPGWVMSILQDDQTLFDRFDEALPPVVENAVDARKLYLKAAMRDSATVVNLLRAAFESHFGMDFTRVKRESIYDDLVDSALWYMPMCDSGQEFIPFLKYQLTYLFAKAESQTELPDRPTWMKHKDGMVLLGRIGDRFKYKCFGIKIRNLEWRNTVLHGIKKGLPHMGETMLVKNLKAMKARLTVVKKTPSRLRDEIARTAREVFPKGILWEDWAGADPYVGVSSNASYEYVRSKGGNLGLLRDMSEGFQNPDGEWELPDNSRLAGDQLGSMAWCPTRGVEGEIRYPSWLVTDQYQQSQREAVFTYKTANATAKPIFEPLKIRMISASDLASNGVYSKLQQALWKGLQRFPQFSLTGRPVGVEDLKEILRMTQELAGSAFSRWVSGDYSAATDSMHNDATLAAISALSGDPITLKVLKQGLMDNIIDFGENALLDEALGPFKMTNGQLMGCVFSFPILCIVNIAVYRAALEIRLGREMKISELPVRVNGDDILFRTDNELLRLWESGIPEVGFEKSVGKNYVSTTTAVINSQYFRAVRGQDGKFEISAIPYLNCGWIAGQCKTGASDAMEEEGSLMKIRPQVEQTTHWWLKDPQSILSSEKEMVRREAIVKRFRSEILFWNWNRIKEERVSAGGGPGGLLLTDREQNPYFDLLSYYSVNEIEKPTMAGISVLPRTMVPNKYISGKADKEKTLLALVADKLQAYIHSRLFRARFAMKEVTEETIIQRIWEQAVEKYIKGLTLAARREFCEARYSVGALF